MMEFKEAILRNDRQTGNTGRASVKWRLITPAVK